MMTERGMPWTLSFPLRRLFEQTSWKAFIWQSFIFTKSSVRSEIAFEEFQCDPHLCVLQNPYSWSHLEPDNGNWIQRQKQTFKSLGIECSFSSARQNCSCWVGSVIPVYQFNTIAFSIFERQLNQRSLQTGVPQCSRLHDAVQNENLSAVQVIHCLLNLPTLP